MMEHLSDTNNNQIMPDLSIPGNIESSSPLSSLPGHVDTAFIDPSSPLSSLPPDINYTDSTPDNTLFDEEACEYEEVDSDEEDDTPCPSPQSTAARVRYHRFLKVLNYMKRHSMSVEQFIVALHGYNGIIQGSPRYRTQENRRRHCTQIVKRLISSPDIVTDILAKEFNNLRGSKHFQRFTEDVDPEKLDFSDVGTVIKEKAPIWNALIRSLMSNQSLQWRSNHADKEKQHELHTKRLYLLTAVISFTRSRNTSNFFQGATSLYFHGLGVKQRVVQYLSHMGLCNHPTSTAAMIARLVKGQKVSN